MRRRVMACRECGRFCYKAMLADGTVVWVSHGHPPFDKSGTIICPEAKNE